MSQFLTQSVARRRSDFPPRYSEPVTERIERIDRSDPCSAAYCLPDAALEFLTRQLLAERPGGDKRFCCYRIAGDSPYADIARTIECKVFDDFFGNSPDIMTEQYGPYEAQSSFLLVVDRRAQRPAGALRIIEASAHRGLKTLEDIKQGPLFMPTSTVLEHHNISDLSRCWDVGSVAVLKEYRGQTHDHMISTTLYGRLHMQAASDGIEHFTAILDSHAFSQIVNVFGVPFVPIVDTRPFPYLGSESNLAAYCYVPSIPPMMSAHLEMLDVTIATTVRPYVRRVAYGEGIPEVIRIEEG